MILSLIRWTILLLLVGVTFTASRADAQSSMCYAKSGGSDVNDGSYWSFAKADVMACYDALPPAGGAIYIMAGGRSGEGIPACKSTDPEGCGIWIMGRNDPNYSHPPAGWRKAKPVRFVGVGPNGMSGQGHAPMVNVSGGNSKYPLIWLSSSTTSIEFDNIGAFGYPQIGAVIGEDSMRRNTASSGWIGVKFDNVGLNVTSGRLSAGPGVLIGGGNSFDIFIRDSVIGGNPYAAPGSDNQAAILILPPDTPGSSDGLLEVRDSVLAGGGLKAYGGRNPASLMVDNVYSESINGTGLSPGMGTVWIVNGGYSATIKDVTTADAYGGPVYDVFNGSSSGDPGLVRVLGSTSQAGAYIYGPAEFITSLPVNTTVSPLRQRQEGFDNMRVVGFTGNAQRQFSLYGVTYPNLLPSSATSWGLGGRGGSIASGIMAPDGTSGAGELDGATTASARFYNNGTAPWNLGDYWIASEWVRSPNGNYGNSGLSLLASLGSGNSFSCSWLNPPHKGDGEWFYKSQICKVTTAGTNTNWIIMSEGLNYASTTQIYAPLLIHIPAGRVSDNEAYEIWNNLSSYSSACPVGAMCGLPGKPVVVSSYGTLSNCSSSSSPAACGSAAAGSVMIAPGSSSVVVDTTAVTANSQITLTFDSSLGSKLGAACNIRPQQPYVTARTAGRSFTISVPNNFTTNPGCISYSITN